MSRPNEDESRSSRGLADILREAGISAAGAGGRRRRRDDADPVYETAAGGTRRDRDIDQTAETTYDFTTVEAADPFRTDVGGLSSYLLTDTPTADRSPDPPPRTDTGPVLTHGWATPGTGWPEVGARARPTLDSPYSTGRPPAPALTPAAVRPPAAAGGPRQPPVRTPAPAVTATASVSPSHANRPAEAGSASPSHANRASSPAARTPAEPDQEESALPLRGGAVSWAILIVELLAALGLGIAAWYAFSALWELLPFVAAFAGPLVVTGLVAVAGALRARTGRNPLGLPTLCILVFAGTVLVVLPATTVILP